MNYLIITNWRQLVNTAHNSVCNIPMLACKVMKLFLNWYMYSFNYMLFYIILVYFII